MTADKSLLEGVDNLESLQKPRGAEQEAQIDGIPIKFIQPSSSPEEELESEDEKTFVQQEEVQQKKAAEDDASFSRHVGGDIKGSPSVTTRSSLKRRAPASTGENLPVTKRRRGRG
ncbi:hypothetical protein FMEXI_11339 [Fusarium mexicanum]|uniref:Uncharacterized protein n=1 Tax=Fusarium mexicanum TaxID=751941 RepID=A0A8H5IDI8_9HYPO|nr:hypothetical protein FMEXI_11339 [Fusarium mexicanum]